MQFTRRALPLVLAAGLFASASAFAAEPENTMIITLKDGEVQIALRPDLAPKHVEQIKTLVREGAYDNVAFHRVIPGFMAQTGDVQFGDMADDDDGDGEEAQSVDLGTIGAAGHAPPEPFRKFVDRVPGAFSRFHSTLPRLDCRRPRECALRRLIYRRPGRARIRCRIVNHDGVLSQGGISRRRSNAVRSPAVSDVPCSHESVRAEPCARKGFA